MRALIVPLALLPDRAMVAVELKLAPSLATSKPVGAVAVMSEDKYLPETGKSCLEETVP